MFVGREKESQDFSDSLEAIVGVKPVDENSPQIRRDLIVQASAPGRSPNAPR